MKEDFVKIRKGTDTKYAMDKCCMEICKFIMNNGVNLKQKQGFVIYIREGELR